MLCFDLYQGVHFFFTHVIYWLIFFAGLPAQHTTLAPATAAYYAATGETHLPGGASPTKYHENGGHDTFSDFVTLVCQEAQGTQPQHQQGIARSPIPTTPRPPPYYSSTAGGGSSSPGLPSTMYPPPPPPPIARPVTIIRSAEHHPQSPNGPGGTSSQSPTTMLVAHESPHGPLREVRLSPTHQSNVSHQVLQHAHEMVAPSSLSISGAIPAESIIEAPPRTVVRILGNRTKFICLIKQLNILTNNPFLPKATKWVYYLF